ncbi:MAG: T9SS type A sorting domain-containing protein [Flavobacteriales bacterium]|nr:T9SS type A sorting domain-containing protein [Flavobacteriales bacterium]
MKYVVLFICMIGFLKMEAQVNSIEAYPQVFVDSINVAVFGKGSSHLGFEVYDLQGYRKMDTNVYNVIGDYHITFHLDSLPDNSKYMLKVVHDSGVESKMIIKQQSVGIVTVIVEEFKIYGHNQNIIIEGGVGTASVYNIAGKQRHRSSINSGRNAIAIKGKGIYIVRVAGDKGSVTKKMLIE